MFWTINQTSSMNIKLQYFNNYLNNFNTLFVEEIGR